MVAGLASNAERICAWADVPHGLAELVVIAANRFDVPVRLLRSNGRMRDQMQARWWLAKEARGQGYSFPQIGRALNRDHSTIVQYFTRGALA